AARFAAFVAYYRRHGRAATRDEALRFARRNWQAFLPSAREGLGSPLQRPASRPGRRPRAGGERKVGGVVYHDIQFTADMCLDLERSAKHPLERVLVRRGARRRAQLRPHVVEMPSGPVEVADLFFDDGCTTRAVPFACFGFCEPGA